MTQFASLMNRSQKSSAEPSHHGARDRRSSIMDADPGRSRQRRMNILAAMILAELLLLFGGRDAWTGERIVLFVSSNEAPYQEAVNGLKEYLASQSIETGYEVFSMHGDAAKTGPAIRKIKAGGTRLVVTFGSMATEAALREMTEIPVVACMVLRTDNLRKAPNATGVGLEFPLETQFAWMQKLLPDVASIGVIYQPSENQKRIRAAADIARKAGLRLEAYEVDAPQYIPEALDSLSRRAEALWGLADSMTLSPSMAKNILLFSFRNNIPLIGPSAAWVKAGALYSLDWNYADLGAQCGEMAQKILAGAAPSSLPPATPRKVLYSLNLTTARRMKLTVPEPMVRGARQVY